jgi:hypothetical protein
MELDDPAPGKDYRPKYFELLSPHDQEQYGELRSALSSQLCRNRRGKRVENFAEMMTSIRVFCIRHDEDDWKRCLVCGVYWLPSGIAINNRQLSILLDKCKSSINGSLQKMGYSTLQGRTESGTALSEAMPVLANNFNELREWTVRLFMAATPQPSLPVYNVETRYPFQSPVPSQYPAFPLQQQYCVPPVPAPLSVPQPEPSLSPAPSPTLSDPFDDFCLFPKFLADDNPQARQPDGFGDIFPFLDDKW